MSFPWRQLIVDNEWFDARRAELTPELTTELWRLRGFPADPGRLVKAISCGLGYLGSEQRWVLPMPNINGHVLQAKAWRSYRGENKKYRWMTAGGDNARENHAKRGIPIGRVWDLPWLDRQFQPGSWLWFTAGEWDCLAARLGRLPATCLTIGESASSHTVNPSTLLTEFGGAEIAQRLMGKFRGIVICYDADEAGDRGAVLLAGALEGLCDEIKITDHNMSWRGIRAVNLRESPMYQGETGWDFNDFVVASKAAGKGGLAWLRDFVETKSAVGKRGIADMLGVDLETSMVSEQLFVVPSVKIIEVDDLVAGGLMYAKAKGSRAQGAYHMGIRAEAGGWSYKEMEERHIHLPYLEAVNTEMPRDHPFTEKEFYTQLQRAMAGTKRPEYLDTDLANMLRLYQYYNYFRWHDVRGCMYWDGVMWKPGRLKIHEQLDGLPDRIDDEAAIYMSNGDMETGKKLRKWSMLLRKNSSRLDRVITMASERPMFRPREEIGQGWDNRHDLLGTPAGVLDLTTGEHLIGPQARDAYCSITTNGKVVSRFSLEPNVSECWTFWDKLVAEWQPDEDNRRMLQEVAGTCLVGILDEHLWLFKSSGRSGKSTFIDALSAALGGYGYEISGKVLGSSAGDNPRSSAIAGLDSRRMTAISEVGGQNLDINTIKALTGERSMMGRSMRENWGTIQNCSTFVAMTNLELNLRGEASDALKERLIIVDWPMSYVGSDRVRNEDNAVGFNEGWVKEQDDRVKTICIGRDPEYPRMLDVVLSWMLEGWERVRDRHDYHGVRLSRRAMEVTKAVWASSDVVAVYFSDANYWAKGGSTVVATNGLWNNMRDWATRNGETELYDMLGDKPQALAEALKARAARGFEYMAKVGRAKALWSGEPKQCYAWKVPYTYVGPK